MFMPKAKYFSSKHHIVLQGIHLVFVGDVGHHFSSLAEESAEYFEV